MKTNELSIDRRKKTDKAMRKQHIETYSNVIELVLKAILYILTFRWIIIVKKANTARKVIVSIFAPCVSIFLAWHLRIKQQYNYWYFKDYIWTWVLLGTIMFLFLWFIWEEKETHNKEDIGDAIPPPKSNSVGKIMNEINIFILISTVIIVIICGCKKDTPSYISDTIKVKVPEFFEGTPEESFDLFARIKKRLSTHNLLDAAKEEANSEQQGLIIQWKNEPSPTIHLNQIGQGYIQIILIGPGIGDPSKDKALLKHLQITIIKQLKKAIKAEQENSLKMKKQFAKIADCRAK